MPASEGKGRVFQAKLVAYVTADTLWGNGSNDFRPIWAVVSSSDAQLRPFLANWTRGRKAESGGSKNGRYEILKSAGYQTAVQRFPEGSIATVFLPELVRADPGMVDPDVVRFAMLPSVAAAKAQVIPEAEEVARWATRHCAPYFDGKGRDKTPMEQALALVPHAYLFAVYLDRRTRCPLVADGRFYLQLMLACLAEGSAKLFDSSDRSSRCAYGLEEAGIDPVGALTFWATQEDVEELVGREVTRYFGLKTREETARTSPCPYPQSALFGDACAGTVREDDECDECPTCRRPIAWVGGIPYVRMSKCAACGGEVIEVESFGDGDAGDTDIPSFCSQECYDRGECDPYVPKGAE